MSELGEGTVPSVDVALSACGDQNHIVIDREHGLIRRRQVTQPRPVKERTRATRAGDPGNAASTVRAGFTYRPAAGDAFLDAHGFVSRIRRKKSAGQPMSAPPPLPAEPQGKSTIPGLPTGLAVRGGIRDGGFSTV